MDTAGTGDVSDPPRSVQLSNCWGLWCSRHSDGQGDDLVPWIPMDPTRSRHGWWFRNPARKPDLRLVVEIPLYYVQIFFDIPGGAGFQPSTVSLKLYFDCSIECLIRCECCQNKWGHRYNFKDEMVTTTRHTSPKSQGSLLETKIIQQSLFTRPYPESSGSSLQLHLEPSATQDFLTDLEPSVSAICWKLCWQFSPNSAWNLLLKPPELSWYP